MKKIKKHIETVIYDVCTFLKDVKRRNLKYAFAIQFMFLDDVIKIKWARNIANKCHDYAIHIDYDEEWMEKERLIAKEVLYETQFLIEYEDYSKDENYEIDEYDSNNEKES